MFHRHPLHHRHHHHHLYIRAISTTIIERTLTVDKRLFATIHWLNGEKYSEHSEHQKKGVCAVNFKLNATLMTDDSSPNGKNFGWFVRKTLEKFFRSWNYKFKCDLFLSRSNFPWISFEFSSKLYFQKIPVSNARISMENLLVAVCWECE